MVFAILVRFIIEVFLVVAAPLTVEIPDAGVVAGVVALIGFTG